MIYTCTVDTPLGTLRGSAEDGALTGLYYTRQKHFPLDVDAWIEEPDAEIFIALRQWLEAYFTRSIPELQFSLTPRGTEFQMNVWKFLLDIPYGATTTYGAIARRFGEGKKMVTPALINCW